MDPSTDPKDEDTLREFVRLWGTGCLMMLESSDTELTVGRI